ncbi:beta-ketoacyl-[acyl-carrier-protein] synthase family protein [Aquihabitans daechungensis]|uniref:beta-ketoacyl-[acyl-carrier-protein] synthase family protein n=1 Tax=Aquihabitans daechungensis TaxID=1052257 RepID=UPI003B9EF0ED
MGAAPTHRPDGRPRVVVTGFGVVSPAGRDAASTFDAVLAGRSAATPIATWDPEGHPVRFAAQVTGLDPAPTIDPREARRMDRVSQLGIVAAQEALEQAGLAGDGDPGATDRTRVAVVIGSGVGGILTLEDQIEVRVTRGVTRVGPLLIPMMMANATAGLVALRHGFRGAAFSVATACASGVDSIGQALDMIRAGRADVVVAGGAEAAITPTAMAAFARMGALSTRNDDPAGASRPFDRERDGFVMGEGAGVVVLESAAHAAQRGATVLGELAGYGSTCDAHHITAPDPDAAGAIASMHQALADAGLTPAAIAHVNAHGTSTPLNDAAESLAMEKVFGDDGPPVTSTKGVTGHLIGATGAVEAILALQSARAGTVPMVANLHAPDVPGAVDLVLGGSRTIAVARPSPTRSGSAGTTHRWCWCPSMPERPRR